MVDLGTALKSVTDYVRRNVHISLTSGPALPSSSDALNRRQRIEARVLELEQLAEPARVGSVTLPQFEAIREELRKEGCSWPQELTSDVVRALAAPRVVA